MALEFLVRAARTGSRIALFPGAWNPPTVAHREIARAAALWADEVVWVLPRAFPHKDFAGAGFAERCRLLELVVDEDPAFSAAVSDGGLYAEIADEAREYFGAEPEIGLVCGRDAAERIAGWDYGRPGVFEEMLARHPLLVASRTGEFEPSEAHKPRVRALPVGPEFNDVSSSEVRRRMREGLPWEHLVPGSIVGKIREVFGINC